jgi:NAD(P)-dependent dehydrogenase (short-subunit alcohol dehydrogenase family)
VIFAVRDMVGRVVGRVPIRSWPLSPAPPAEAAALPRPHTATNGAPRRFSGKTALVTGSGRGLGKVIAQQLAALGATVVVNSFHSRQRGEQTTEEILATGGQAVHVWGSVAQPSHLDRMFEEIDARFGGLDFLVSNASTGTIGSLKDMPLEYWGRMFQTNVVGLHQAALRAAPLMRRRGGGRIVAISSIGTRLCFDEFGGNGPVKAALESLVRYLAVELGPDSIQVNSVSAGPISGEWLDQFSGRPRWETLVPRRRFCTELEVAEAVLFLLSNSGMNAGHVVVDAAGSLRIC